MAISKPITQKYKLIQVKAGSYVVPAKDVKKVFKELKKH